MSTFECPYRKMTIYLRTTESSTEDNLDWSVKFRTFHFNNSAEASFDILISTLIYTKMIKLIIENNCDKWYKNPPFSRADALKNELTCQLRFGKSIDLVLGYKKVEM